MGDPKKIRKKYETPPIMWDSIRIRREHDLKSNYGLKNLRELWILASELRRIRKNVRDVLSGRSSETVGRDIIARLSRYSIVKGDAALDDLLVLNVEAFLERRLQTVVLRKGLAKSFKQARQLVSHGFIAINGRRLTSPGHLVLASEETAISYYKPIDVMSQPAAAPAQAAPTLQEAENATVEEIKHEHGPVEGAAEPSPAPAEAPKAAS